MTRLCERGHAVDLQVLDNKVSTEYLQVITQTWKANFQIVTPDVHRRNAAEHAIRTFKAHFLAILVGFHSDLPSSLWDTLLPQTELTLNLSLQATLAPDLSGWEYYNGPINYDATPFSPVECFFAIQNKPGTRK